MSRLFVGKELALGCPKCGVATRLVVRMNRRTKEFFAGCPNWPKCDFTQEIPDSIWMEASGQPRLFGE